MTDVRQMLRDLVEEGKALHQRERRLVLDSVLLVGRCERLNAAVNLGMSAEKFAKAIGLTIDRYRKRAQVARVLSRFPEARAMLEDGTTRVSHLALIAARITEANGDLLLSGIKDKTRREVEALAQRVTPDGRLADIEPTFELRLKLTGAQMAALDRAREVLSCRGRVPSAAEIVEKALTDLLERRDPLRKAERAAARQTAKADAARHGSGGKDDGAPDAGESTAGKQEEPTGLADGELLASDAARHEPVPAHRPAIPAAVRHQVWLRDQGQCTWIFADGSRCSERAMVELDHFKVPYCRGGEHQVDNLTLRCRYHNAFGATLVLGEDVMSRWQQRPESCVSG